MYIFPYSWKQELYIPLNLQTIVMILKHRICNDKYEAWNVTFPEDPRNETYHEERKQ